MTQQQNNKQSKSTSIAKRARDISLSVQKSVQNLRQQGKIDLPPGYSVGNALSSAYLMIAEVETRNKEKAVEVCREESIYNSLFDMVVQGLNPQKKQCYFIARGKNLMMQRSYFGNEAVVKRFCNVSDVLPEIVYVDELDGFKVAKKNNRTVVLEHDISPRFKKKKDKLESTDDIAFAYCTLEFNDSRPDWTDIMDIEQIKQAWRQGELYDNERVDQSKTFHAKFTKAACIRTIINHTCKRYINSSSDNALFVESFNRTDITSTSEDVQEKIAAEANQEVLDINPETGEVSAGDDGPGEDDQEPMQQETEEDFTGLAEELENMPDIPWGDQNDPGEKEQVAEKETSKEKEKQAKEKNDKEKAGSKKDGELFNDDGTPPF